MTSLHVGDSTNKVLFTFLWKPDVIFWPWVIKTNLEIFSQTQNWFATTCHEHPNLCSRGLFVLQQVEDRTKSGNVDDDTYYEMESYWASGIHDRRRSRWKDAFRAAFKARSAMPHEEDQVDAQGNISFGLPVLTPKRFRLFVSDPKNVFIKKSALKGVYFRQKNEDQTYVLRIWPSFSVLAWENSLFSEDLGNFLPLFLLFLISVSACSGNQRRGHVSLSRLPGVDPRRRGRSNGPEAIPHRERTPGNWKILRAESKSSGCGKTQAKFNWFWHLLLYISFWGRGFPKLPQRVCFVC